METDINSLVIGLGGSIIIAIVAIISIIIQHRSIKRQIESSIDIAKMNMKGSIIYDQQNKWIYSISSDIAESLTIAQSMQDILNLVSVNRNPKIEGQQKLIEDQIKKYLILSEKLLLINTRIQIMLDTEKGYHKELDDAIHNFMLEIHNTDLDNLNPEKMKHLNSLYYATAKKFIKKERIELIASI
jgi:hypothetical protein